MPRSVPAILVSFVLWPMACGGPAGDIFSSGAGAGAANGGASPVPTATANAGAQSAPLAGAAGASETPGATIADAGAGGVTQGTENETPQPCPSETCNGLDDDCNGVVDDACPTALWPEPSLQRTPIGDSPGGATFADSCASDELLVGLSVAMGQWLERAGGICRRYTLYIDKQSVPYRYSLLLGAKRSLALFPANAGGTPQEIACADGSVMVGLRIWQQHNNQAANDNIIIPRVALRCARPVVNLNPMFSRLEWADAGDVGPVSGPFANDTGWIRADSVSASEILVGINGAAGAWMDRLGLNTRAVKVLTVPSN